MFYLRKQQQNAESFAIFRFEKFIGLHQNRCLSVTQIWEQNNKKKSYHSGSVLSRRLLYDVNAEHPLNRILIHKFMIS